MTAGYPIACLITGGQRRRDDADQPWRKGGSEIDSEKSAQRIIQKNAWVLALLEHRQWLNEMINDPLNHRYDNLSNAFVTRAQEDLAGRNIRINRKHALCLHRLFLIRSSQALKDALSVYETPNPELN